jgi:hypothetical protein
MTLRCLPAPKLLLFRNAAEFSVLTAGGALRTC